MANVTIPAVSVASAVAASKIGLAISAAPKAVINGVTVFATVTPTNAVVNAPNDAVSETTAFTTSGFFLINSIAQEIAFCPCWYIPSRDSLSCVPIAIFKFSMPFNIFCLAVSDVSVIFL